MSAPTVATTTAADRRREQLLTALTAHGIRTALGILRDSRRAGIGHDRAAELATRQLVRTVNTIARVNGWPLIGPADHTHKAAA